MIMVGRVINIIILHLLQFVESLVLQSPDYLLCVWRRGSNDSIIQASKQI